jgi:hypothetical protein
MKIWAEIKAKFSQIRQGKQVKEEVEKVKISKEQFALLLFEQDKNIDHFYDEEETFEAISQDDRDGFMRYAECYLDNFDQQAWPEYVRNVIGKSE